jgi:hypothetical protein
METVRDLWPADRPRLTGELGRHYRGFLAAATRAMKDARFEPARLGGCPVPQLVAVPFAFKLNR